MKLAYKGKNAIVTGASGGMGLEISKMLSENNINVLMLDIQSPSKSYLSENVNCIYKKIDVTRAWSVTYDKGHYHVPHNHSSQGYAGIIYLQVNKDSPKTTYIQPWNNEKDQTVLYAPDVKQGDIMIVPQFLTHYTEPNKTYFKKRILSFDFTLLP